MSSDGLTEAELAEMFGSPRPVAAAAARGSRSSSTAEIVANYSEKANKVIADARKYMRGVGNPPRRITVGTLTNYYSEERVSVNEQFMAISHAWNKLPATARANPNAQEEHRRVQTVEEEYLQFSRRWNEAIVEFEDAQYRREARAAAPAQIAEFIRMVNAYDREVNIVKSRLGQPPSASQMTMREVAHHRAMIDDLNRAGRMGNSILDLYERIPVRSRTRELQTKKREFQSIREDIDDLQTIWISLTNRYFDRIDADEPVQPRSRSGSGTRRSGRTRRSRSGTASPSIYSNLGSTRSSRSGRSRRREV